MSVWVDCTGATIKRDAPRCTLAPTNLHVKATQIGDDYQWKECITKRSPGAGFIGDPVDRLVWALFSLSALFV